jgi:hypothetical protein
VNSILLYSSSASSATEEYWYSVSSLSFFAL